MIATFTKLLRINTVANKRFGLSNNSIINWFILFLSSSIDLISAGENEKKATSDPDTKAETAKRSIIAKTAKDKVITSWLRINNNKIEYGSSESFNVTDFIKPD